MKTIEYADFKKNDYDIKGISNYKLINGTCHNCKNIFEYSRVKVFIRNRKNLPKDIWDYCQKCFFLKKTSLNEVWIEKNRQSQLIAQNKPEQKIKNANAVSKSWTQDRKNQNSLYLKERWKDDVFAKKALKNLEWTQSGNIINSPVFRKSVCVGGHKGQYKEFPYDSSLELSFILYCLENNIKIQRCNFGINYIDENKKNRMYYPDFIIKDNIIVEIKGYGLYYNKFYERNICKIQALKDFCTHNDYTYSIFFQDHEFVKSNYKKARKLHNENKKENSI
jgi:hypothetical protein